METSITNETISQQTICGEPEYPNKDRELDQAQSKEYINEIEQTRKNLIHAREVYFNYLSSQRMARTKYSVRSKAEKGDDIPSDMGKMLNTPRVVAKEKKVKKMSRFRPGTQDLGGNLQISKINIVAHSQGRILEISQGDLTKGGFASRQEQF